MHVFGQLAMAAFASGQLPQDAMVNFANNFMNSGNGSGKITLTELKPKDRSSSLGAASTCGMTTPPRPLSSLEDSANSGEKLQALADVVPKLPEEWGSEPDEVEELERKMTAAATARKEKRTADGTPTEKGKSKGKGKAKAKAKAVAKGKAKTASGGDNSTQVYCPFILLVITTPFTLASASHHVGTCHSRSSLSCHAVLCRPGKLAAVDFSCFLKPKDCRDRSFGAYTTRACKGAQKLAESIGLPPASVKQIGSDAYSAAKAACIKHKGK
eukprot:930341-Pyramimonas_sp.AAC.1